MCFMAPRKHVGLLHPGPFVLQPNITWPTELSATSWKSAISGVQHAGVSLWYISLKSDLIDRLNSNSFGLKKMHSFIRSGWTEFNKQLSTHYQDTPSSPVSSRILLGTEFQGLFIPNTEPSRIVFWKKRALSLFIYHFRRLKQTGRRIFDHFDLQSLLYHPKSWVLSYSSFC